RRRRPGSGSFAVPPAGTGLLVFPRLLVGARRLLPLTAANLLLLVGPGDRGLGGLLVGERLGLGLRRRPERLGLLGRRRFGGGRWLGVGLLGDETVRGL